MTAVQRYIDGSLNSGAGCTPVLHRRASDGLHGGGRPGHRRLRRPVVKPRLQHGRHP
ncbi:MAG: hypothetical protein WKG07_11840 [Hymenobacter sp.]